MKEATSVVEIEGPGRQKRARQAPTIYDIARLAGVNASTVSRALNNPDRVTAKTRKLVEVAAAELNYKANHFARALPTGKTQTLGLIVADITNPTFFDIIRGAGTTAAARGYTLVLAESTESPAMEMTVARRMLGSVDGVILASPRMGDDQILDLAGEKPVVVINRDVKGVNCVVPDVDRGISQAVRSLAGQGHRSVLYIAGPEESWMSGRRWEGIQAACDWSRLVASRLESATPTVEGGRRLARDVLVAGVTAVITYNDLLAIGLMQELQAAGVRVPETISIVGFDDIFGADFTSPPLTTVRSPVHECGVRATGRLLEELAGAYKVATAALPVETELILRGSSAPPN
ncbi:LacI family DNA-binding transcriptional regulator [Pseudarthrobacter equi]|uniref:LacI family DNA-binding transcriptional regulator n=2 Tax=Bacteria TaxID=2 RepID=UPI0021BE664F|nr:LacI family DNA-binding transcriptional regulator [Pseudarthrobacter equi]MCT9627173.1 LacI family DNA-binding transcriptional regulator [Pseudarthrobacter equi]